MRLIIHRFLIASLAAAAVWACGSDGSSDDGTGGSGGSGGTGGTGGEVSDDPGTCGNPIDYRAVKQIDTDLNEYVSGSVADGQSVFQGKCGGKGKEVVYQYTAPSDGVLTYFGIAEGDAIVTYARSICDSPDDELECVGAVGKDAAKAIGQMKAGDKIYLIVDSSNETASNYTIKVTFSRMLKEGDNCRPDGLTGVCTGAGLVCGPLDGMCMKDTPPEITSARVLRTPTNAFHLEIEGKDAEANATSWYARFYDDKGEVILDITDSGNGDIILPFAGQGTYGKRTFKGTFTQENIFTAFPKLSSLDLAIVEFDNLWKEFFLSSEVVRVQVEEGTP